MRYGHWPTRLRLSPWILENIRDDLLSETGRRILESKLALIPDPHVAIVAEDDAGRSYSYQSEGFPSVRPKPDAEEWLGIAPDTPYAHED